MKRSRKIIDILLPSSAFRSHTLSSVIFFPVDILNEFQRTILSQNYIFSIQSINTQSMW